MVAFWTLGDDGFWTQAKQLRVREVVNKNVEKQRQKAGRLAGANFLLPRASGMAHRLGTASR